MYVLLLQWGFDHGSVACGPGHCLPWSFTGGQPGLGACTSAAAILPVSEPRNKPGAAKVQINPVGTCLHINGLVQERPNSIALAMELRLSCTNPWTYTRVQSVYGSDNERPRYIVTLSLICWAHTQNNPCTHILWYLLIYKYLLFYLSHFHLYQSI